MSRFSLPDSIYTYAFLLKRNQPLDLPEGIWGSLELVCLNQLAALVEPNLAAASLHQSDRQLMQAVLSHDRVIQEVFQQTAVLPLRFGTYFTSRQGLLGHLQSHQSKYLSKLIYLRGKAEYVLKLIPVACSEPPMTLEPTHRDPIEKKILAKWTSQHQTDWPQQQQTELQSLLSLISETGAATAANERVAAVVRVGR